MQKIFPYGFILPENNHKQDRRHIYTLYGIRRPYIVLDLDFMPGVTKDKIRQSMVLDFDPVKMPTMFDVSKLPPHFECTKLPVIVQKHEFLEFYRIHRFFRDFYFPRYPNMPLSEAEVVLVRDLIDQLEDHGKREGLNFTPLWDRTTTTRFLRLHESTALADPDRQVVFREMDWSPKTRVKNEILDDMGPLDRSPCAGVFASAGEHRYETSIYEDMRQDESMDVDMVPQEPIPAEDPPLDENMKAFIRQKWQNNDIRDKVLGAFENSNYGLNGLAINASEWMADNYPEWMEYNHPEWRRGRFKRN